MALGRISGPLLKSNLQRTSDLAVETNLLYIGHTDGKIGIKTVTRPRDFTIDGTAKFRNSNTGQPDLYICLLYTSPSPRDQRGSRMPSSA